MPSIDLASLSRRERQLMEALLLQGKASAEDLRTSIDDAPSNSAVRTTLKILEGKGFVRRERDGQRFLYTPVGSPSRVRRSALRRLIDALFGGSRERAFAAMLEDCGGDDLDALEDLIARERRRRSGR